MTALDHVPMLLLGRRGDVPARNALLALVLDRPLEPGTSFVRYLFLDPTARERIVNWSDFAAAAVGPLRYEAGRRPHDSRLTALIEHLRRADADVSHWWDADQRLVVYTIEPDSPTARVLPMLLSWAGAPA